MTPALILLGALVALGLPLYIHHRLTGKKRVEAPAEAPSDEGCCGMHEVCERDIRAVRDPQLDYFDDEELDAYRGRSAEAYTEAEVEVFRDVLMTLLPGDLLAWGHAMERRKIEMPADIRDEYLLLLAEQGRKDEK